MARFYKTASANPLDYMYQMNTPLMERVLETNEQYITENLGQLGQLDTIASSFPFLQADEARAKEISGEYAKQIDSLTEAIRKDPANYRKQLSNVRDVGRNLMYNMKSGEISKIVNNYNLYKKTSDYIDKQLEQFGKDGKGISADRARAYKQYFLNRFSGTQYEPTSGVYNTIQVFDPMSNMDIRKTLSEELDKMKADGTIRITDEITGTGEYFNKETNKWEGITPERVLKIATDRLNNPQLMDYLRQDSQVGLIRGVFNMDENSPEYGQFISPYQYQPVSLTSAEQSIINKIKDQAAKTTNRNVKEQLNNQLQSYIRQLNERKNLVWNDQSYLAPILRGIVNEYAHSKTEQGSDLTANPIWQTRFTQAQLNARQKDDQAFDQQQQQRNFDHLIAMQEDRQAFEREMKLLEWANKPKTGTAKKGEETKTPKTSNAIIGTTYTTPYYWTTQNKENLTTGLNDEITVNKNVVSQLESALNTLMQNNPNDKILIANAENQLNSAKVKLSSLEAQREKALDYAINEWKAKGQPKPGEDYSYEGFYNEDKERLVRNFLSGKAKQDLEDANRNLQKEIVTLNKIGKDNPGYFQRYNNEYRIALSKKQAAENIFTSGQRIFTDEVKPYTDSKLEKAAQETTNSNQIVRTTDEQDERVIEMINATPSNYKIIGSDGKEMNLSFEHGTATTDPKKFRINGVSATTGLGDKQVEISATINGKNVIIVPKDDGGRLTSYFATQFTDSQDKDVANIGRILSSPTAATIMDMMTEMRMNTGSTYGTEGAWVYKVIPNPANPRETIKIRSRAISTGGGNPKWEVQVETNNRDLIIKNSLSGRNTGFEIDSTGISKGYVPLQSTRSMDGIYHNLEDLLSVFPNNQ